MKKLFIPVKDLRELDLGSLSKLRSYKCIAVAFTAQFSHRIKEVANALKDHEIINLGTVLGCSKVSVDADCVLIVGTGEFHALNIAVRSLKPVFILSPNGLGELDSKTINDLIKKRSLRIAKVLEAKILGVLVSTKPGQHHEDEALKIVNKLNSLGKEAYLFVSNEMSPMQLNDFNVDAWISTACPRISEDDFEKPLVSLDEIREYL